MNKINSLKPSEIKTLLISIEERAYNILKAEIWKCEGADDECEYCPRELYNKCITFWNTKCCDDIIVSHLAHNLKMLKDFKKEYSKIKEVK